MSQRCLRGVWRGMFRRCNRRKCKWSVVIDDRQTYRFLAREWIPQGFLVSVIVVCICRDTALILGPAVEAVMRACVGYCLYVYSAGSPYTPLFPLLLCVVTCR